MVIKAKDAPAAPLDINARQSSWVLRCLPGRFPPGSSPVYPGSDPISSATPADKSNVQSTARNFTP